MERKKKQRKKKNAETQRRKEFMRYAQKEKEERERERDANQLKSSPAQAYEIYEVYTEEDGGTETQRRREEREMQINRRTD